jgi:3-dehydroquinate dehydratase-2
MAKNSNKSKPLPIYIINGPNLNLLGTREPEIYGRTTLGEIEKLCAARARDHGLATVFLQSNKEGELVEFLQEARATASGVIINAAAYTHTSVAILDALQMLNPPVIEVHLSNPARREEFRHLSYVAKGATGSIAGLGVNSYLLAIDAVAAILASGKEKPSSKEKKRKAK